MLVTIATEFKLKDVDQYTSQVSHDLYIASIMLCVYSTPRPLRTHHVTSCGIDKMMSSSCLEVYCKCDVVLLLW